MSARVTLRLPEPLIERLRERSAAEGRSLNDTAVQALRAGLEGPAEADGRALGPLVEVPPRHRFDLSQLHRVRGDLRLDARGVMQELDWLRGPS